LKLREILILWLLSMAFFMSASGQQTADDWNQQGIAFAQTGKYDEAIQAFDKAISINSSYADAWSNKGTALYSHGEDNDIYDIIFVEELHHNFI